MKRIILLLVFFLFAGNASAQILIGQSEATAAQRRIPVRLALSSDHLSEATGQTFSGSECKVSKNGGSWANCAGSVGEIGNGAYYYEPTSGEVDTLGALFVRLDNATTDPFLGAAQVGAVSQYPDGTAQGGAAGYIDLASSASSVDSFYNNNTAVAIVSGAGAGQNRCITGYTGSTRRAAVGTNFTTAPDSTSKYILIPSANCNPSSVPVTIASGGITSSSFASGAIDATAFAQAAADKIWTSLTSGMSTSGSIGKKLKDWTLGADNKVLLSTDAQTGVTIPTVTTLTNGVSLSSGAVTAASVSTGAANKLADHFLRRNSASVEASSDGDTLNFKSLLGAISKQTNKIVVSGGTLTIYYTNGSVFSTQTVTTNSAASPITGLE